eukprot:114683_1
MNTKQSSIIKDHPVTGQALIDLTLLTMIIWMILVGGERKGGLNRRGGSWCPHLAYLSVLLVRWLIVPHRDWVKDHKHHQEEAKSHLHHHHHHAHHHPNPVLDHHHHHPQKHSPHVQGIGTSKDHDTNDMSGSKNIDLDGSDLESYYFGQH